MISAHTRTLAIIGDPIEHSLTPRIQNHALRKIGADIVNLAFRVVPENLQKAIMGAQNLGFLGLMVTIPHKEAVLALCDELHRSAQVMGAANLLHFRDDGRIIGHSSDGWAALKSLEEEGVRVQNQSIAILGGGGAARSLALTFALEGATEIRILNRTISRAQIIAAEVEKLGVRAMAGTLSEESLEKVAVVVNATSVGMTPETAHSPLPKSFLRRETAVYDIVYNPLETRLLREAREVDCPTVDGLGMLLYTNVYAAQVCAGVEISAGVMREEALLALGRAG
ncbi:MAG: shikimate dehydrogenase [Armatimonadetes bacterium]|nr:shikimate dehydrogenase [Armatimonadota bacterium]